MISCRQNIIGIGRKAHGNSGTIGMRSHATVFRWHRRTHRDTLKSMPTPGTTPFADPKYVRTLSGWLDPMVQEAMVTTPHYLASQAGVSVLKNGGMPSMQPSRRPLQQRCAPYRFALEGSFRRRDPVRRDRFPDKRFLCELVENPRQYHRPGTR